MARRLLVINGLAVIGAVINHALGWGFTALFWWTDRYEPVAVPDFSQLGTPTYYALRALEQLVTASVPVFLFVTGYFIAFASGRASTLGWDKVAGRLRMLLIPYVLWSVAILVGRTAEGFRATPTGYLEQLLFGRAAEPYYYIPMVTQLYLLAPLTVGWLQGRWKPVLLVAAAVQLAVLLARYPVMLGWDMPAAFWIERHVPGWFFPHTVFWFVFGAFAGFYPTVLKAGLARWSRWLPVATVAIAVLAFAEWELLFRMSGRQWLPPTATVLDSLYSLAVILTIMAFGESLVPKSNWLDSLGARSFGVYLIHAPVLELMSRAAYHVSPLLLEHQMVFMPLLIVAGVCVPLLAMTIVNRTPARPYYNYLFG